MRIKRGRLLLAVLSFVVVACVFTTARSYAIAVTNATSVVKVVVVPPRRPSSPRVVVGTEAEAIPVVDEETDVPSLSSSCTTPPLSGSPTYTVSSSSFPGVRTHRNVCLRQGDDRLETTPATDADDVSEETSFIFRDVCALGHTPKDVTHMFSFSRATGILIHHVVYGHRCMARVPDPVKHSKDVVLRRSSVFHGVLRHWIDILYEGNVLDRDTTRASYYEDYAGSNATTKKCFRLIVERHETWRWFDTAARATEFTSLLALHFPSPSPRPAATIHRKLIIMLLRRDEDRHYEESRLLKFLQSKFSAVADITLAQYDKPPANKLTKDNDVNVPTYEGQVEAFVRADVVIAAHGAALSSAMAMRPGTAVLELFPHNFRYYMYEELSRLLGLHYFPFEGSSLAKGCACEGRSMTTPVTRANLHGDRKCKKCDVAWTDSEMYYLVKNAISSVWLGYSRQTDIHEFDVRK